MDKRTVALALKPWRRRTVPEMNRCFSLQLRAFWVEPRSWALEPLNAKSFGPEALSPKPQNPKALARRAKSEPFHGVKEFGVGGPRLPDPLIHATCAAEEYTEFLSQGLGFRVSGCLGLRVSGC